MDELITSSSLWFLWLWFSLRKGLHVLFHCIPCPQTVICFVFFMLFILHKQGWWSCWSSIYCVGSKFSNSHVRHSWTGPTFAIGLQLLPQWFFENLQIFTNIFILRSFIPGQAPPSQLLPQRFFENLQIFLQLQTYTTSLTSTATTWMSNCPDARSKWSLEIP